MVKLEIESTERHDQKTIDTFKQVLDALRPIDSDQRDRLIRAVAIFYDVQLK